MIDKHFRLTEEAVEQIESHLLMRHYDGLLNSGHTRQGGVAAY